jgi:hypothetical protein
MDRTQPIPISPEAVDCGRVSAYPGHEHTQHTRANGLPDVHNPEDSPGRKFDKTMPTKKELEQTSTVRLAVMCGKVADDPEHHGEDTADKALKLRTEWASLQTPREISFKDHEKKEQQLATLHTRMVEFLAGIL